MTTHNGHQHVSAFEGAELAPDAESQALLDLMDLADDIEAGRLTNEGHRRAQEALAILQREVERGPTGFRQAVTMAQTNLRGSLDTLTRAIETAMPLRVTTWGNTPPESRQWLIDDKLPAGQGGPAHWRGRRGEITTGAATGRWHCLRRK